MRPTLGSGRPTRAVLIRGVSGESRMRPTLGSGFAGFEASLWNFRSVSRVAWSVERGAWSVERGGAWRRVAARGGAWRRVAANGPAHDAGRAGPGGGLFRRSPDAAAAAGE